MLVSEPSVTVLVGEAYVDPGATASVYNMGITIKPDSNGMVIMGETELPFAENLIPMVFPPTDITDLVVVTVVDESGDDITNSVLSGDSYVFNQIGEYKILYNVADDESGKAAEQIERAVQVNPVPVSPPVDTPAGALDSSFSDVNNDFCFIGALF